MNIFPTDSAINKAHATAKLYKPAKVKINDVLYVLIFNKKNKSF